MKMLSKKNWKSTLLNNTDRYSDGFVLPEFPYKDGKYDREYVLDLLRKEQYGYIDDEGIAYSVSVGVANQDQYCGKATHRVFKFKFEKNGKTAEFPVNVFQPTYKKDVPFVITINFQKELPNRYTPIEELMDEGIAVAHVMYEDVTTDDGDFENGLAPLLTDRTKPDSAGKISIWAYAIIKVGEFLVKYGYANPKKLFVSGHSRLGKTALWALAQSELFAGGLSNCSGCAGAAIFREKQGENIEKITRVFPFWFCNNFLKYVGKENDLPFDQHYLQALVAPRKLCVVTAELDYWADTDAQHLAMQLASEVYEKQGLVGLKNGGLLQLGEFDEGGLLNFSKRRGTHFFSREDWKFFIRNIK